MAVLIWSPAAPWTAALMVVATGGLVTDAAKSDCTTLALKHRVSDAERAHRGAIREAEAELSRCRSACDREVAAANSTEDAVSAAKGALKGLLAEVPANSLDPGAKRAKPLLAARALQMVCRLLAYNAELDLARRLNSYLEATTGGLRL